MLRWSKQFETGHALIDAQHQMLINYINRLETMPRSTNPTRAEIELILQFIEFMENYVVAHFNLEEECMNRFRCPAGQQNKQAHGQFLDFFRQFKRRFDTEGCRPELLRELHDACSGWIQQHILRIDRQLKPCLDPAAVPDRRK